MSLDEGPRWFACLRRAMGGQRPTLGDSVIAVSVAAAVKRSTACGRAVDCAVHPIGYCGVREWLDFWWPWRGPARAVSSPTCRCSRGNALASAFEER